MQKRLKINAKDRRYVLVFFIVMVLITSLNVYSELTPTPTDQFFSMWIVGPNGLTEDYFPNNDPNLILGEPINWTLGVYNHMSQLEYVVVRVKLLNATQVSPNEQTGVGSPVPEIYEFARVLTSNETWAIPFNWMLTGITNRDGHVAITGLALNETAITGNLVQAIGGLDFRFVFELWYYDGNAGSLVFSWSTPTSTYSVWTQLWFNATAAS